MNKTNLTRPLAWSLAALSLALTLVGLAASWRAEDWQATYLLFGPVTAIAYALVGALVASRQPHNPIGWLFSAVAVFAALATFSSSSYVTLCLWSGVTLPCIAVGHWLALWVWMPATILPLTLLLLLFPDGRLLSPRWRPVAWVAGLGLAAFVLSTALHPHPPLEPIPSFNPFGIPGAAGALELLLVAAYPLVAVGARRGHLHPCAAAAAPGGRMNPIRIVIADDHPVFRFGLRALLNALPDTEVVGEGTTGAEVLALAGAVQPDVILMDINMPGVNGIEATRRIRETHPDIRILMVTMLEDDSVFAAMRAGARGYVVKGAEPAEVLRAIRAVADGEAIFSPGIAERLIHYFATPPAAMGDVTWIAHAVAGPHG